MLNKLNELYVYMGTSYFMGLYMRLFVFSSNCGFKSEF